MDISTGNWFSYLREEVLTEGLRDIGLPEIVIDYIEEAMPNASEKARMYIANYWKRSLGRNGQHYNDDGIKAALLKRLVEDYGDYVIQQDQSDVYDIDTRTTEPFDINKGTNAPRIPYDDEKIKQAEQVKFVIQNLKNAVSRPVGTWRKSFMKAIKGLSKAGIPSEKVENTKEYLQGLLASCFRYWMNQYTELIVFLNDDPTNYELIKNEPTLNAALTVAEDELNEREDPDMIIHQFDDGTYWYDLGVSNCPVEGERMGHCGGDSRGTLMSLRYKKGKRKKSSSYVTMTYSYGEDAIYQIKGRANDAPRENTWPAISWFIQNKQVENVYEQGEHSSDDFEPMITYLMEENPQTKFVGDIETRMEQVAEAVRAVNLMFDDQRSEDEDVNIDCYVEEGLDGQQIELNMSCELNLQIPLGWEYFDTSQGDYVAMIVPNAQEGEILADERYYPIPFSGHGGEVDDFKEESGIGSVADDVPGDEFTEVDWEVQMMEGAVPEGEDPFGESQTVAHLLITMTNVRTEYADEGWDPDETSVSAYESFAEEALELDKNSSKFRKHILHNLRKEGFVEKTPYERSLPSLKELGELQHWSVLEDGAALQLTWLGGEHQNAFAYSKAKVDWASLQMHYQSPTRVEMGADLDIINRDLWGPRRSFQYGNKSGHISSHNNAQFDKILDSVVKQHFREKRAHPGQTEFPFGDKYKAVDTGMLLAENSVFAIFPEIQLGHAGSGAYPSQTIRWLYQMRVDTESDPDEAEVILDIAAFLDENPDLLEAAAEKFIGMTLEGAREQVEKTKQLIYAQPPRAIIQAVRNTYGDREDASAMKRVAIVDWIEKNWSGMQEPEKYVAYMKFLKPLNDGSFRLFGPLGQLDLDNDYGKPVKWDELVDDQKRAMGGAPRRISGVSRGEPIAGRMGEPRPVQESVEQQIARIEKLLEEQAPLVEEVDVRLYKLEVDAKIAEDRAAKTKQLQDQLRGIENVTTVSAKESIETPTGEKVRFTIKFALVGQQSRVEFVANYLIPAMNSVVGVEVINQQGVGWSAPVEVTPGKKLSEIQTLDEYGFGSGYGGSVQSFGGMAGQLGSQRYTQGTKMSTPRPMIQQLIDDWAEGGVMGYDVPAHTNDMRYHVMFPVEELLPFMDGKEYRGDMKDFEGRYQQFIKDGPTSPVYLAVGQVNQTAKVTGGEDLIWFAKKAGLEELPVFISYQRQV